ncbi:MAG: tRNA uridine-5-carboxymethylaminomethyl(34) synthesis GTPase MnmE [Oscillibacter sp.]|uniref:tRNA uridine-5-carboxymethylaminomethyl(34) synthesis GTPase MnmE n=1 Tax=Oscillibacter sp. TaxID=1945593 RepID=UPI00216FF419|nr:tRNA uridine-5-carboxymethylaminomethyl(34) synthesis GTPase MnmE [Oscillibacter sp.]MCI8840953.1 tRNA uridine-5-carboxymethylaminomethyl(34) synthesis GTPase MnmE [Oscillibacter sp.]MCI9113538.1 tRNA uridine-5-carboxymethylaminomethyl(34) synthesis GTPase MnmE [Oscillibacter sp.]
MDTIAAIAAGGGAPSAIGVVRISGPDCFAACGRVFRSARPFGELEARRMVLGEFLDREGRVLDRGLAVRFPGPRSYTGEDSAEFHCHGSPVVLREVLAALFAAGARQAGPGEFTKRAFLNGRLDLTQAEAVIDLIDAETAAAARNAAAQLDGGLRRALEPIQEALLDITSRFYAVVDYPDEDIQDAGPEEIAAALRQAGGALTALLSTCKRGKVLKRGVRTAIVGLPNAGKSSLLNALAGYERAIVTDIPGTTRDTVEEAVLCGGVLLRLIDTAGLRETEDAVEKLGVERSRRAMEEAELILLVRDGAVEVCPENKGHWEAEAVLLNQVARTGKPWLCVESKCDLTGPHAFSIGLIQKDANNPAACLCVSSVTGYGLDKLENAVAALFPAGDPGEAGSLLTDRRQEEAADRARAAVRRALEALENGLTPDAALTDAEEALDAIGELTGRTAKEEIVERIFSRFCVGK